MSRFAMRLWRSGACLAALGICTALPLHAQQQPPQATGSSELEEVVVTARKREESLQSVPVSVTAITAEQLGAMAIQDPYDLQFQSAGLEMGGGRGWRGNSQYFIRGLGGTAGVNVYVDDVPIDLPQLGLFSPTN